MSLNKKQPAEAVLRDATADDLAAINEIYNHYVLTCTCTYQEVPDTLASRTAWFEEHGANYPVIVAEVNGEVVAWGSLSAWGVAHKRNAYRFTAEDSVYIRNGWQGRGLGTIILAELIRRAKTLGFHSILASISSDRTPSIRLHEKLGFVKLAHLPEIGFKFDRWLDVVHLQKRL